MLDEKQIAAVDAFIAQVKDIARRHSVREEVVCAAINNTNTIDLSGVVNSLLSGFVTGYNSAVEPAVEEADVPAA